MKVLSVKIKQTEKPIDVVDMYVDKGLVSGGHSALPDIDVDYASDRRQEMKEYLEERYNINGKQRVFSAGTFTTLKLKAVLKDVARVHRVPHAIVNYITAIFDDDKMGWTDLFLLAATNKKVNKFIKDYPLVIEDIRTIMGQPKSTSIHASAIIVTPETKDGDDVECFDFLPIRKMDGLLVSEFDGYAVDEIGLLKEDVLATKELSKLSAIINIVNKEYNKNYTIESITQDEISDPNTYKILSDGYTQNVFQFSSRGITKFIMEVMPDNIEDLIAINALYRPATLEIGATDDYVRYKHGEAAPVYNFGTHEATKNTYGIMCIAEGSNVRTMSGHKKIESINIGDMVLTESGSYQKVINTIPKGIKETIKIHGSFGEELICTPDHKVCTQYGWVEAGKLLSGHHLIKSYWTCPEINTIGSMKDWCLGIYLANGSSISYPATISCRNEEEANIIKDIFDKEFNLSCSTYYNVRCWYVRLCAKKGCTNGYFSPDYTPNKFNQYLRDLNLLQVNVYNKKLDGVASLKLLAGFIEGDGCMRNGKIRLRNIHLAKYIYNGLQAHRIPSAIFTKIENNKKIYVVSFNDNALHKLPLVFKDWIADCPQKPHGMYVPVEYLSTINTKLLDKSTRSNIERALSHNSKTFMETVVKYGGCCKHELWSEVLSIEPYKEVMTYDLSIENDHSFVVGGLVVHNCYQEQFMSIANTLGGFDLGKTDFLRKAIGKKKADLMATLKEDFIKGAINNGCPDYEAEDIWHKIEVAGKYSFNRSHAAAYALTAYCGAWLKTNYSSAFYTIALQWAKDDEIPLLMSEMEQCSKAKIVPPNINVSCTQFFTNYQTDEIFWSLTRIKMVGVKTVDYIIEERTKAGAFTSIENFIHRIFKYKLKKYEYWDDPDNEDEAIRVPVNARQVKNLILAGCFDKIENVKSLPERYRVLKNAAQELGFAIKNEDFPIEMIDKHYFWSALQIETSGIGSIDYRRIYDNSEAKLSIKGKASYMTLRDALDLDNEGKRIVVCATILEHDEISYKDKKTGDKKIFCKIKLQQNNDIIELVMWDDYYKEHRGQIINSKNKMIIVTAIIKYSDYSGCNNLQTYKSSLLFNV